MTGPVNSVGWLRYPQPRPHASLRLFCFPSAGSGASIYRAWPNALPPDVELVAVQLPGREDRFHEAPFVRLDPLIRALLPELVPALDRPFAFFGHSMGALIAFELARGLRGMRVTGPRLLCVAAHRAPQLPMSRRLLHVLPDTEFWAELSRLGGTSAEILDNAELRALLLTVVRADLALCETHRYVPEPPLDCPILAFGGLDDQEVRPAHLDAWRDQSTAGFKLHLLPGDHFFLRSARDAVLHLLGQSLERLPCRLNMRA